MPLLPGEILNQRYHIVCLLGEGAYGVVYRAWDSKDQLNVALKEYLDPGATLQKEFRAEVRRLLDLEHEQIPQVLDHFSLNDVGHYLVSDYIDGIDLQSLLTQYGPLPSDLLVPWLQAVGKPLTYLHRQKQLHLNIKPANIRLTPNGRIFLVDTGFPGLGLRADSSGYTAPEVQSQIEASPQSDIYSLGATLYTLLTGQRPPDGLRRESGLVQLTPAREVNPDVEPYLSLVATRAMSLRPDTRYESVTDFMKAVERPLSRPTPEIIYPRRTESLPKPATAPPRRSTHSRRQIEQRTILGLGVVLAVVIFIGLMATFLNSREDKPAISEAEATATLQSAVIAAMTDLAPTPSPLPIPTTPPTPSPEPIIAPSGARMLYMPGGQFRMGDDEGERDEQPSHVVNIDPYFMDETEVTNGEYALCVADDACSQPSYREGANYHPAYYGNAAFDEYPVAFVTWTQADSFCKWRGARLPSEAEWEMAAGFDPEQALKLRYPWGDAFDGTNLNFCDQNCPRDFRDGSIDDGHRDTAPVTSYVNGRSPIGLYNMVGNVSEWVGDWYDRRLYETSTDRNPMGPAEGTLKVLRGGSWLDPLGNVSVVARDAVDPAVARANIGFRCALTAP